MSDIRSETLVIHGAWEELRAKLEARRKRRSVLSESEDLDIAKAWTAVSEDAIVGSEKKEYLFFQVLHGLY